MTDVEPTPVRPAPGEGSHSSFSRRGLFLTWGMVAFIVACFVVGNVVSGFIHAWWHDTHPKIIYDPNGPVYICHTYPTWDDRDYAAFMVPKDGKYIACQGPAGPVQR